MPLSNLIYVILNKSEIVDGGGNELIDFSQLLNTNATMLRYSADDSKGLVKYSGVQPSFLNGKTTYTHAEIRIEMVKSAWASDPIEE